MGFALQNSRRLLWVKTGHFRNFDLCPLLAISGLMQRSKFHPYSITRRQRSETHEDVMPVISPFNHPIEQRKQRWRDVPMT
jgi:hypothetical protein